MKINKAFKFRIYPNQEQQKLIKKTFGCVRFVYKIFSATVSQEYTGAYFVVYIQHSCYYIPKTS